MLLLACLPEGAELPAANLAAFHDLSAGGVAELMQKLTAAGLVLASPGRGGGYRLARAAGEISVLEIVTALDGIAPEFHCREIRRDGVCAGVAGRFSPRCAVAGVMDGAVEAWRAALRQVTLAALVRRSARSVDPSHQAATAVWLDAHSR